MEEIETQEHNTLRAVRKRYEKKHQSKPVSFNIKTEAELLAFANGIPDFSNAVKNCCTSR